MDDRDPTRQLEFETMLLSRHSFFVTRRRSDAEILDRSAYVLLNRIQLDGPMSISELSDAFGLDVSTLNRQTAAMMREGLVDRIPDPAGGIARKFRITDDGTRRVNANRDANTQGLQRVLHDWTPSEVAEFAAMLARFNRDIEELEQRPWPRPRIPAGSDGAY